MQIRFADTRPAGDYALVLPVAGKDRRAWLRWGRAAGRDGRARPPAVRGEASSASEQFVDDNGTVAPPAGRRHRRWHSPEDAAEKLGGTAVARLLTSGETKAVIDLTGLVYDADAAARVGLAAALRSWRYDRYRTKLKDKQKPTLDEIVIVGGGQGAGKRYAERWAPVVEGVSLTRELVTEPANIIYPEASSSGSARRSKAAASRSRCSIARRWRSSAWARCSVSPKARSAKRGC